MGKDIEDQTSIDDLIKEAENEIGSRTAIVDRAKYMVELTLKVTIKRMCVFTDFIMVLEKCEVLHIKCNIFIYFLSPRK